MKSLLVRASGAVLVAAAALSAACSNDPMAPKAPTATRTPSAAAPSHYIGAVGANGSIGGSVSGPVVGDGSGGASTNSGYLVTWGKDGQTPPPSGN